MQNEECGGGCGEADGGCSQKGGQRGPQAQGKVESVKKAGDYAGKPSEMHPRLNRIKP